MSESAIVRDILLRYGRSPSVRLFRNNCGVLRDRNGTYVAYGLCKGSSDIIGWQTPFARFIALEVKVPGKNGTPDQLAFLDAVARAGGIAGVVRSVEDCYPLIGQPP